MKRFIGIAALAACLSLVDIPEVQAGGPLYLHFKDYCDCATLYTGALAEHAWIFGTWDWKCDGSANTLIHGLRGPNVILGTQPVDANGAPAGFSATIVLEGSGLGSDHAHITATFDGITNVLVADEADYYLKVTTPCPHNGKPPLFP